MSFNVFRLLELLLQRLLCRAAFFPLLCLSSLLVIGQSASLQGQIIFDDFDDDALGWQIESLAGNFGQSGWSIAEFGYDYSQQGIPEAPNTPEESSETLGLRLRTGLGGLVDQVAAYLEDDQIAGDYSMQVDMWLNWSPDPNETGTTLHAGPFVGWETDENPRITNLPVQRGAGILVSSDGDCTNCDYILLKNAAELDLFSGQYAVGFFNSGDSRNQPGIDNTDVTPGDFNDDGFIDGADFTVWRDTISDDVDGAEFQQWAANYGNAKLDFPTLFPEFELIDAVGDEFQTIEDPATFELYTQRDGAAGFRWLTMNVDVRPNDLGRGDNGSTGTATFSFTDANSGERVLIGTVDNSVDDLVEEDENNLIETGEGPVALEGYASLTLVDFFNGAPNDRDQGFVIYDNFQINSLEASSASVPEPSTTQLAVFALIALLIFDRRRTY